MLHPTSNAPQAEPSPASESDQRLKPGAPALALDPAWRAGRKLSEARRQLGLSLDEVAERIRVRREFLEALEQMNVKLLPGKAYTLAFLRSYARALGIEEKAIVDQFQDECALTREAGDRPVRSPSSKPRKDRPWMAAAAIVVVGAVLVGWRALDSRNAAEPAAEAVATAPASGATTQTAAAETRRVVEIKAVSEGWLETRGPDGTVFFSRTLQAGDVYRPDPSPGWTLHARDGSAFEIFVDGVSAGPLGPPGMAVLGRSIDDVQPLTQAQLAQPRS